MSTPSDTWSDRSKRRRADGESGTATDIGRGKRAVGGGTCCGGIPMRALTWHGAGDVRVEEVPNPRIVDPHDAIIEVTATAICGSDLHLYDDLVPTMREGDVVAVGSDVETLSESDRVVVPFTISCGSCWFCERDLYSLCDNSNPNAEIEENDTGLMGLADSVKRDVHLEADRPHVLRQAIRCCRKGGTLSVPGGDV